jgi:hypothetical protein
MATLSPNHSLRDADLPDVSGLLLFEFCRALRDVLRLDDMTEQPSAHGLRTVAAHLTHLPSGHRYTLVLCRVPDDAIAPAQPDVLPGAERIPLSHHGQSSAVELQAQRSAAADLYACSPHGRYSIPRRVRIATLTAAELDDLAGAALATADRLAGQEPSP